MVRLAICLMVSFLTVTASLAGMSAADDPEAIADLRVARGSGDIASAWLIAPTGRYGHFVQGSEYEPSGLRVSLRDGTIVTLALEAKLVFEDRQPRLADLDGDGEDEIVLVLSHVDKGASLAAYGVIGGVLTLKAQTPFIGQAYRWLNPAGIGDFDGDGRLDVALVAMPHLARQLQLWTLEGGQFVQWGTFENFSNHRNGSKATGMSAQLDFDGDGVLDLALPAGDRKSLRLISLKDRTYRALKTLPLPAPADGDFELLPKGEAHILRVPLEDGAVAQFTL